MFDDDLVVRRGVSPHRTPEIVGAREAERILGVSRPTLNRLAKSGRLKGRLVDKSGMRRQWSFLRTDVTRLKQEGTALLCKPKQQRIRVAWMRHFGAIPEGLTVIPRDGNAHNTAPENLSLVPLASQLIRINRPRKRPARHYARLRWTKGQVATLRREYPTRPAEEIAKSFGISRASVQRKARQLRLRKTIEYLMKRASEGRRLPLGTERICKGGKTPWIVMVKVSNIGTQAQQWRPKHHVAWEEANGRKVPKGMRILFKDGNKSNFDPANLELATRGEISALGFAKFLSLPPPLQKAIRMTKELDRQIESHANGQRADTQKTTLNDSKPRPRARGPSIRWTDKQKKMIRRDYPNKPAEDIATTLGVSTQSVRLQARRLGVRRSPEAFIKSARAKAALQKAAALR